MWQVAAGEVTLAEGVPLKDPSKHADPALTLRAYAHMPPSSDDRVREDIDRQFGHPTAARALARGR